MSEETNVSSVTTEAPAAPEKTGRRLAEPEKPEKKPLSGRKKAGLIVGIIGAVLVLAYAGCCVAAGVLYSHVAFPGTSVLGMGVSSMSRAWGAPAGAGLSGAASCPSLVGCSWPAVCSLSCACCSSARFSSMELIISAAALRIVSRELFSSDSSRPLLHPAT